jgi:hypothetical protein
MALPVFWFFGFAHLIKTDASLWAVRQSHHPFNGFEGPFKVLGGLPILRLQIEATRLKTPVFIGQHRIQVP